MEEFIRQRVGQTLGQRWVLQSVLGVGGMAAVYAATDSAGGEVAVKILHPEIALRAELRDRFLREGALANRVQHPGAVRVLEQGASDDRTVYLVMERLQGQALPEGLSLPELLDVLDQVLDILAVAHDAGIVHRDLKPDNLFLTDDGAIKVLDFGVARVLESAPDDVRTRTGMAMGTLPYMAPEQALGKRAEIDGRVDIFALGATAFRVLARRRVHEADSEAGVLLAMATKAAPRLSSVAPHVPEGVAAIIDLALAFDREARYPDARTMQEDVRAVLRGEQPPFASARSLAREQATRAGTIVAAPALRHATPEVVPAVTPPPAPSPWNAPIPEDAATLPRIHVPAAAVPAAAPAPQAVPLWLVAAGAVGCLLFGALLWLLWPSSQAASAEPESGEEDVAVSAAPSAGASSKAAERTRENAEKHLEKAREKEKKRARKEAGRRRDDD
jgi:serine/threonine-protein kinase